VVYGYGNWIPCFCFQHNLDTTKLFLPRYVTALARQLVHASAGDRSSKNAAIPIYIQMKFKSYYKSAVSFADRWECFVQSFSSDFKARVGVSIWGHPDCFFGQAETGPTEVSEYNDNWLCCFLLSHIREFQRQTSATL
jgi:hypothetical protein